ncbi:4'-phosphopantetheinyl transferase family protein [Sphaerisporangium siamense]|uniref:4'-phosphopantetheinyl transferase EntD n=1 Tax=Sphaerisporangium siamense TaxID=795645 RepID=A0A7W7D7K5_9ACTN|nr:4'-phosphopantetheinyl transferase superfamily protein [Sphaerisporangium siamense]MBB4701476.1 4'-phosphopantetheinyl transferase EntD [Sphaerisporangium siamense]
MIERIVPTSVACADLFEDPSDVELFPEEEEALAQAVDKRRREFTSARACVRRALGVLGLPPAPVVPGPRGEPGWPGGVVGSITHCEGYRGAALARSSQVAAIGIDAEPNGPLPEGVLEVISLPEERVHLAELSRRDASVRWERLLFCAKETVYKAWFPLTGLWLDFEEASVEIDPARGTFAARLLVPGPTVGGARLQGFSGRLLVENGLILTAIVVPSPGVADLPAPGAADLSLPGAKTA